MRCARSTRRRVVVGRSLERLHPLDLGGHIAKVGRRKPEAQSPGYLGEQRHLRLQDRRQFTANGSGPEVLQLTQRGGVEGSRLDRAGAEAAQSAAQLAGGPSGEGDGQNVRRRHRSGTDRESDAVGDRPGLAGARTGKDADRPADGLGRRPLLGVERAQDLRLSHRGHRAILAGPADTPSHYRPGCGDTAQKEARAGKGSQGRSTGGRQLP